MCRTQSWIGWRASILALALATVALAGPKAGAVAISASSYSTWGTIDSQPDDLIGTPAVRFQGVDGGTQGLGAPFSLGEIVVSAPGNGQTTTYASTPFSITYQDRADSGTPTAVAHGFLQGTVSGSGQPHLWATLDSQAFLTDPSPSGLQYQTGDVLHSLTLNLPLAVNQAVTSVMVVRQSTRVVVPEPSSWAFFLAATAALGWLRWPDGSLRG